MRSPSLASDSVKSRGVEPVISAAHLISRDTAQPADWQLSGHVTEIAVADWFPRRQTEQCENSVESRGMSWHGARASQNHSFSSKHILFRSQRAALRAKLKSSGGGETSAGLFSLCHFKNIIKLRLYVLPNWFYRGYVSIF